MRDTGAAAAVVGWGGSGGGEEERCVSIEIISVQTRRLETNKEDDKETAAATASAAMRTGREE